MSGVDILFGLGILAGLVAFGMWFARQNRILLISLPIVLVAVGGVPGFILWDNSRAEDELRVASVGQWDESMSFVKNLEDLESSLHCDDSSEAPTCLEKYREIASAMISSGTAYAPNLKSVALRPWQTGLEEERQRLVRFAELTLAAGKEIYAVNLPEREVRDGGCLGRTCFSDYYVYDIKSLRLELQVPSLAALKAELGSDYFPGF